MGHTKKILIVLAVLLGVAVGLYKCVEYEVTPIRQTIATEVDVTNEWQEFQLAVALIPRRQTQHITLNVEGYSHDPGDPFEISLANGSVAHPEIVVVTAKGESVTLKDSLRLGNTAGFSPQSGEFQTGQKYTKVMIRSDVPFKLTKLGWIDMNLK